MNEQFKAGDEVYCPQKGFAVYVLEKTNGERYPTMLSGTNSFTPDGRVYESDGNKAIFHATPENKQLLEALYKCEFESPKLKGSDLTRKLLSEGNHVLCYVNCHNDISAIKENVIRIIDSIDGGIFRNKGGSGWKYAVPCNDYANLPDGVLEAKK